MLILPIRHHSPAAALLVRRLIRERRPRAVLVEGPADADPLIPLLLDPATVPPVALYAYRGGESVRATFYPFCRYSPEYVALAEGAAAGARLAFCDLPAAVTLDRPSTHDDMQRGDEGDAEGDARVAPTDADPVGATHASPSLSPSASPSTMPAARPDYAQFIEALTRASGHGSFEEFWEAAFEQPGGRPADGLIEVMADFGGKTRALVASDDDEWDALRERQMAATARALVRDGIAADDILLVCGAAHAQAVAAAFRDSEDIPPLPPHEPVEMALIPFSFPRLSEQSGYGAGNRAPWYYEQVWELEGDFSAATRRAFVVLARRLRQLGYPASPAQCIDAATLAATLAAMREKMAPGVDEVTEAAVACFGQGKVAAIETALRPVLVGETVGQVTHRVGRTPLQAEFYATAQRFGITILDAPQQVLLHMTVPAEAERSVFLHRLGIATVPFARELASGLGGRGRAASGGPLEQLARVREKWELQWSPSTDAALVERTAWGNTLAEVCTRLLRDRLDAAERVDDGTAVLLQIALCELTERLPAALDRCDALAADSVAFPRLARATYHLDGLLSYGAARRLPVERLTEMAGRFFRRSVLHAPAAAICGDEDAAEVERALASLHELVLRGSAAAVDPDAYWAALETIAELPAAHAALRGQVLALLEQAGRLPAGALAARLRYWLSATAEAADNARLVAGLFSGQRGVLLRNRALIAAVTDFLVGLELERLTPLLPVLRRTLGNLSTAERNYLAETLETLLGLRGGEAAGLFRVTSTEEAWLREAGAAVAATLAGWRERYGIE